MTDPKKQTDDTAVDSLDALRARPNHTAFPEKSAGVDALPVLQRSSVDTNSALTDATEMTVAPIRSGLHGAEAARARTIGFVFGIIGTMGLIWSPFLGGDGHARVVYIIGLTAFVIVSGLVWYRAAQPERYTYRLFRLFGAVSVFMAISAMAYLGPFSPTALAITLGISFFGQGADRLGAWSICLSAIILSAMLLVSVGIGLIEDVGVFRQSAAGVMGHGFMILMVPLVLFVTTMQAHWSRRSIEDAMGSAVNAVLDVKRKNVQLEEAQAELDRIFGAGGLSGRLTGEGMGRFRLGPLLGRGAAGEVYDAVDPLKDHRAAVKVLTGREAEEPAMIARFKREGVIAQGIRSPHVAKVYEYGQDDAGYLYIAMERLEGADLAGILRKRGRISARAAHRLVRHTCAALAAAHDQGIIHRDIKPHNIYAHSGPNERRIWKVLDFGISKWLFGSETLTNAGCVVGTPRYMAPEQALGKTLDQRADIYSLGAVLYRALTGSPPVQGGGYSAIAAAAFERPVRPRIVAPDLDPQIEAVMSVAMAPQPHDRFPDASSFAQAYDQAFRGTLDRQLLVKAKAVEWRNDG